MKVIDLSNTIANGEEVPKKIKYDDEEFVFTGYNSASKNYNNELEDLFEVLDGSMLNDEVEIIEEEKKIPGKLNLYYHINNDVEEETGETTFNDLCDIIGNLRKHEDTINSIIDYLKSKGE